MNIHLSDKDLALMPEPLRVGLLNWLVTQKLKSQSASTLPQYNKPLTQQLALNLQNQSIQEKEDNSHVRLTQLFDAGITKSGMLVRVRLKRKRAKQLGREYINNLEISDKGTIIYNGEEFDKPSPLAKKINKGESNGWEYIEVKKDDKWICLDELRQTWRNTNG
ncbi:MAG: hypothetical protein AAF378_02640 [Cyanobacteria bacterium P01_A01_bin.84]